MHIRSLLYVYCSSRPGGVSQVESNESLSQMSCWRRSVIALLEWQWRLWLLLGSGGVAQTPESSRVGIRGSSAHMPCDLSYSRGKWKADDSIQSATRPFPPLGSLWRTANQLPDISIPVSCLVLFSPAAHQISESTCAFKWCPLELSWAISISTAAFTQH